MTRQRLVDRALVIAACLCFAAGLGGYARQLWRAKHGRQSYEVLMDLGPRSPAGATNRRIQIVGLSERHGPAESRVSGRVVWEDTGQPAHVRLLWYRVTPWGLLAEGKTLMPDGNFSFVGPALGAREQTRLVITAPNAPVYLQPGSKKRRKAPPPSAGVEL